MAILPSLTELLKAGVHFGHKETKWHPKMAEYIFTVRNGIQIIDLEKTVEKLKQALEFLRTVVEGGGVALFVGTKPQARKHVQEAADRVNAPYVTERWLGGTLTNFAVIQKLVRKLEDIEQELSAPEVEAKYTKLERLMFERERARLTAVVGGIRTLKGLPQVIILADVIHDETAVREARRKLVPTIALCDTNTNPEVVTYPIPANDEASRSIELFMSLFGKTIEEGVAARAAKATEAAAWSEKARAETVGPEEKEVVVPDEIMVEAVKKVGLKEELVV
ncbi:30S ribosomal protein S2 [Candidatus Uhrbacteria bacterium RIFCSPLOWO2_02_FULL_49_11]|uniref:Small ribosomal subunit protein uS2 n=1 Tax=Candidatus Uhrbacteria bacterium RIFCSPLOWO2_02_FULL_49_11 TaxID=1802409 RepID=A0A1F7VCR4_9BACT|nr:MAG: 30S ribosomal protein S2 [Candidatus Uhrbacteria bacterium RIFCSPLOWO2_02_FULL_49_11]